MCLSHENHAFQQKQFPHVFSLEHAFSKDETKNSRIARSLGTAVFLLCNRKISYIFSSCLCLSLKNKKKKKKRKKKKGRKKKKWTFLVRKEREPRVLSAFYSFNTRKCNAFRNGEKCFCYSWQVFRCICINAHDSLLQTLLRSWSTITQWNQGLFILLYVSVRGLSWFHCFKTRRLHAIASFRSQTLRILVEIFSLCKTFR